MSDSARGSVRVIGALLAVLLSGTFQSPLVDDAFITFRYAANAAAGHGLVYNPGEVPILGTTTPLWAYVLALTGAGGIDIPLAARGLNLFFIVLAACIVEREFIAKTVRSPLTPLITPFLCLLPFVHFATWSGMETPLYLLLLSAFFALRSRPFYSSLIAGFTTLVRPDGWILVILAAAQSFIRGKKIAWIPGFCVGLAWLVWAQTFYGSFFPHSIAAKKVVHSGHWIENLLFLSESLLLNPLDFPVFVLSLAGLVLAAVWRRLWEPVLWFGGYVLGLVVSGVKPVFYWYYAAPWFIAVGFGLVGLFTWADRAPGLARISGTVRGAVMAGIGALLVLSYVPRISKIEMPQFRDLTYVEIGRDYRNEVKQGESLYACETGTLGYYFPEARMIDSSGINSPQVLDIRRLAPPGSSWSLTVIETEKPDWIVSPLGLCQMRQLEEAEAFQREYERVAVYLPEHLGGIGVYRKRK